MPNFIMRVEDGPISRGFHMRMGKVRDFIGVTVPGVRLNRKVCRHCGATFWPVRGLFEVKFEAKGAQG